MPPEKGVEKDERDETREDRRGWTGGEGVARTNGQRPVLRTPADTESDGWR